MAGLGFGGGVDVVEGGEEGLETGDSVAFLFSSFDLSFSLFGSWSDFVLPFHEFHMPEPIPVKRSETLFDSGFASESFTMGCLGAVAGEAGREACPPFTEQKLASVK